jgi:hypothetical protein
MCLSTTPATDLVARDLFPLPTSGLRGHLSGRKAVINKRHSLIMLESGDMSGDMSVCDVINVFMVLMCRANHWLRAVAAPLDWPIQC